jgi:hypothetical protein
MSIQNSQSRRAHRAHRAALGSAIVVWTLTGACTTGRDASPASGAQPSDTIKSVASVDSAKVATSRAAVTAPATAAIATAAIATPDTATPHLISGRNKHDSLAFVSTVAFGRRQAAKWPAPPAPLPGSILPAKRIVAFYGNPLSKRMGVLGEYPSDEMLAKLDSVVRLWQQADPSTPVQPALHLIAVVAQGTAGRDGMYRARMDSALIEKVYGWAQSRHALLFLDVQVAKSTMQRELPHLMPFLARPDVHLGMDAEFSMHYAAEGSLPSKRIGQFDAADVNWVSQQLRQLVTDKKLPPKILVVHRWTKAMISHASAIEIDPRVQIVMHMDGWGPPWMKFESFRDYIDLEPVEFTGFKIFFHNDVKRGDQLLTPGEVLWLRPRPLYIQYQ